MGAWIEIIVLAATCGTLNAAPFVGAWIEIPSVWKLTANFDNAAPFVGAWIEIFFHLLKRII